MEAPYPDGVSGDLMETESADLSSVAPNDARELFESVDHGTRASSADVLTLLREYRAAENTSRRESRRETAMGETDLIAMRLLVEAESDGRRLTPGSLSTSLGISTASTTALIDRLATAGFVERRPHETDRRSTVIVPTVRSEREVREALTRMQSDLARVADGMSQHEIDVVARFLTNMISAVRGKRD
ncbi:MarR family transcriptional regulator [Labedella populi]|uniref:MarR family transcriptional regulator n=1 Tax=Labedella populi TaxID=2498850 RepID=A0A3S4EC94_9MICO|nr:MarR family transcriptional regulator [Labedella populi]RWZ67958.1 MarR family transcriptional regulator [Labedella populi]